MTSGEIENIVLYVNENLGIIVLIILWSLLWKSFALWHSARLGHKFWFIAFIFINALGTLEIIYLFFIANKYRVELVEEKEKSLKK